MTFFTGIPHEISAADFAEFRAEGAIISGGEVFDAFFWAQSVLRTSVRSRRKLFYALFHAVLGFG